MSLQKSSVLAAALSVVCYTGIAHAISWCTTPTCYVSRSSVLPVSCVYNCETVLAATIPLGDEELKATCAIAETEQPYCPRRSGDPAASTTTSTTTTGTNQLAAGTSDAVNELLRQSAAQTEQAYQTSYQQFIADLSAGEVTTTTTSNIQANTISEVPWRQLFSTGTTRAATAQVTSSGTTRLQNTKPACTDTFTRNFRLGMSHEEVKSVQRFLNAQTDTIIVASGEQSKGKETIVFNALTRDAVKKFQQKYAGEILQPVNEPAPTGFWGPFTRKKANELLCSGSVKLESQ
jgi:hypothetical protein